MYKRFTDVFANYITKSHVCISLTYIMSYFIKGGEKSFETGFPHVLSQQEHDVLKAIRHNYQDLRDILKDIHRYMGQTATFTYFERTKAGSYRHPHYKCIRNYE